MRALAFLIVSGIAHALACRWWLAVMPADSARRRRAHAIAGGLSLVLPVLRLVRERARSPGLDALYAIGLVEVAAVVLALVPLGLVLLLSRSGSKVVRTMTPPTTELEHATHVTRRRALEQLAGATVASVTTSALGWGYVRGRHDFQLEEIEVRVRHWPKALDGYTIVQVSDVHVGAFVGERELREGFELVRRARPDLLVATGDLVDMDAEEVRALLVRMAASGARDGAYAILGNHDHYAGAEAVSGFFRASEVRLLDNAHARLRRADGGGFALLGVDDLHGRRGGSPEHRGPDLSRALRGLDQDIPRILLAHQPKYFDEAQGLVDLQLSGHTHGGQINPGVRPASMVMDFVAGRYERAGSTLYVNRGYGVTGPPSRVGAPPEVTKIVIVSG
jgi:predicted MPP superfamily phosphohydrolase